MKATPIDEVKLIGRVYSISVAPRTGYPCPHIKFPYGVNSKV